MKDLRKRPRDRVLPLIIRARDPPLKTRVRERFLPLRTRARDPPLRTGERESREILILPNR